MFPIPWNFPLRKKNGNLVNIGDAIEAGTEIPVHSASDAGKVLSVDTNGALEWSNEVPAYVEGDAGKLLSVDENGDLEWSNEVPQAIQNLTDKLDDEIETRAKLSAHNLLISGVNTTTGNVTGITRNEDDSVTIEPRTGIADGEMYFSVRGSMDFFLPNGTYIMSGGIDNNIFIGAGYTKENGEYDSYGRANATDLTFTVNGCNLRDDGAYLTVWLNVTGDVSSELTIYPMIRLASDASTEHLPFAMTNRELTDKVKFEDISSKFYSSLSENVSAVDCAVYKRGNHIFGTVVLNKTNYFVTNDTVLTLSYKPIRTINSFGALSTDRYGSSDFNIGYVFVNPGSGALIVSPKAENKSYIKFSLDYATND